ncbi:MAG: SH3 domain-containing protein [Bacteroidetes bacterium]|nr:SH3 domain-containing protein [Bacteroidota bacterium]
MVETKQPTHESTETPSSPTPTIPKTTLIPPGPISVPEASPSAPTAITKSSGNNLRSGPGTDYDPAGQTQAGTEYEIIGKEKRGGLQWLELKDESGIITWGWKDLFDLSGTNDVPGSKNIPPTPAPKPTEQPAPEQAPSNPESTAGKSAEWAESMRGNEAERAKFLEKHPVGSMVHFKVLESDSLEALEEGTTGINTEGFRGYVAMVTGVLEDDISKRNGRPYRAFTIESGKNIGYISYYKDGGDKNSSNYHMSGYYKIVKGNLAYVYNVGGAVNVDDIGIGSIVAVNDGPHNAEEENLWLSGGGKVGLNPTLLVVIKWVCPF